MVANNGECITMYFDIERGLSKSNTPKCGDNLSKCLSISLSNINMPFRASYIYIFSYIARSYLHSHIEKPSVSS